MFLLPYCRIQCPILALIVFLYTNSSFRDRFFFIAEWVVYTACIQLYLEPITDDLWFTTLSLREFAPPIWIHKVYFHHAMQRTRRTATCCPQGGSTVTRVLLSLPWLQCKPRSLSRAHIISAKSHVKQGEAVWAFAAGAHGVILSRRKSFQSGHIH